MAKVLFNWNVFPSSRLDQSKTGQLACSYRPLATESQVLIDTILTDLYKCQNLKCGGIINKYCTANKDLNSWTCCFCDSVNRLPAEFDPILTGNDVQLVQRFQNAAVPQNLINNHSKIVIFVIDLATLPAELDSLKTTLLSQMPHFPPETVFSVITFDSQINIKDTRESHTFTDTSWIDVKSLRKKLFGKDNSKTRINNLFFSLNSKAQIDTFTQYIQSLTSNRNSVKGHRPVRITGKAIELAIQVSKVLKLETLPILTDKTHLLVHICAFISGPCTKGPGKVIDSSLKKNFRNHSVFENLSEFSQLKLASKYYNQLVIKNFKRLLGIDAKHPEYNQNCSISLRIDLFSADIEQTGIFEMKGLSNLTGGNLVLADTFQSDLFIQNFAKLVVKKNQAGVCSNGELVIVTGENIKINGIVGPLISLKNHSLHASDFPIGDSLSNRWIISSFDFETEFAVYLQQADLIKKQNQHKKQKQRDHYFIQFQLSYKDSCDASRVIASIITKKIFKEPNLEELALEFDENCYFVTLAKRIAYESVSDLKLDRQQMLEKLDSELTGLIKNYGKLTMPINTDSALSSYPHNDNTVIKNAKLHRLSELFYHLRKSFLLNKTNTSPDEAAFYYNVFLKLHAKDAILAIKPSLYKLSLPTCSQKSLNNNDDNTKNDVRNFGPELKEITLDANALINSSNAILIFDQFYHVVVHIGSSVAYHRDLFARLVGNLIVSRNLNNSNSIIGENRLMISLNEIKEKRDAYLKRNSDEHGNNGGEEQKKKEEGISLSQLDPGVHLLKTVDVVGLFHMMNYAREVAFSINRLPVPRYIETDENKSQARFLYAKLSPVDLTSGAVSAVGNYGAGVVSQVVHTEEISFGGYLRNILSRIESG